MKKIAILVLALVFVAFFATLPVFAAEKPKNIVLPASETVDHDYFAGGDSVRVSGTVNGDAYVGGGTVIVDGKINGDLISGGGSITITGNIQGDVRVGGGNITLTGANVGGNITAGGGNITIDKSTIVQGSLVAGGGNIQILAPIGRGATIGGGTILIANTVGGSILAGGNELSLSQDARIAGDLTYWSENEVNIASGATVSGTVKQETPRTKNQVQARDIGNAVSGAIVGITLTIKVADFAWLLIVGLALIYFLPSFTLRTSDFVKNKFGWAFLIGLITLITVPVLGIILFITLLGIPAAFVLFFVFFLTLWVGRVFAIYTLGRFILNKANKKTAKGWAYAAGLAVYLVLTIIPLVGFLMDLLVMLSGVGALLATKREYYLDLKRKKIL